METKVVTNRPHWLIFWTMRSVSVLAFLMAGVFAVLAIFQLEKDAWIGVVLFCIFGAAPFLVTNTYIQMDEQSILLTTFYGKFKINWDEVKYIETNRRIYAFTGENKRVAMILSPKLTDFMKQQAAKRKVEVREALAIQLTQYNSRI